MVQITPEQLEALAKSEDGCVHLLDPKTQRRYVILEETRVPEADAEHIEYMRRGLVEADEAIAKGEYSKWDKDAFLTEVHQRHGKP